MWLGIDASIWKLIAASCGLFVCLVVAGWLMIRIRSRYRDNEDPAAAEQQMLAQIRDLHRQGDLSEDEYRSIKGRLVKRLGDVSRTGERT
ncbi:MAG: hypothetical protein WD648_03965 [Planctomycetaceae bacterium]